MEAIAIVFLHAYINPTNEERTVEEVRRLWPEVSVIASHEVSREWREYERTNTTVLAAYVHPNAEAYINCLEERLAAGGFSGKPFMMQSNGGITTSTPPNAIPFQWWNPVPPVASMPPPTSVS